MAFTFCALKILMGVDCPGCGLGHSIVALSRGEWAESVAWHPMGVVMLLMVLGWRWRHLLLPSEESRKILSHGFFLGFFVPWVVKLFFM